MDCVLINSDNNGLIFSVERSEIPAKKQDLVEGQYKLLAPREGATVAFKVIDMLDEEAIVTQPV